MFAFLALSVLSTGVLCDNSNWLPAPYEQLNVQPNGCPVDWTVHLLLPHENDCTKFYSCSNGGRYLFDCAAGTAFNFKIQVCDWPQNVVCVFLPGHVVDLESNDQQDENHDWENDQVEPGLGDDALSDDQAGHEEHWENNVDEPDHEDDIASNGENEHDHEWENDDMEEEQVDDKEIGPEENSDLNTSESSAEGEITDGINCLRDCTENSTPKSCYYNFNVEDYEIMGTACNFCQPNATNYVTNDCQCIVADEAPRTAITINRMLPGPAIYVCKGDKVIVDVKNRLDGAETSIHWHGITQRGTPFYDGTPFVTQCPITSGSTFRYQWTADHAGTYLYHSHSGLQMYNGMAGSLVVYEPQSNDPNGDLYDVDSWKTVMILQDWKHERIEQVFPGLVQTGTGQVPSTILVNGKGIYNFTSSGNSSYAEFNVTQGFRYRFRLINALASVCPVSLTIENHTITVISTDAGNVDPLTVDTVVSMSGERYDFIVNATQDNGTYWIQLRGLGECEDLEVFQLAVLRYDGVETDPEDPPTPDNPLLDGVVLNPVTYNYANITEDSIPITQLVNSDKKFNVLELVPSRTFYIPFGIYAFTEEEQQEELYTVGNYQRYSVNTIPVFGILSNITYKSPSSPLLSQFDDIDQATLCNYTTCAEEYCSCTNLLKVDVGEIVDIFIVDVAFAADLYHPIHLHGMPFYVLDIGFAKDLNLTLISTDEVQQAAESGALDYRHTNTAPPAKDTVAIPTNGYAHLRFVADNPGFWYLHCHIDVHMSIGMNLVMQIGERSDMPKTPRGFPKCGSFKTSSDKHN